MISFGETYLNSSEKLISKFPLKRNLHKGKLSQGNFQYNKRMLSKGKLFNNC
jgi:hypothetical protein